MRYFFVACDCDMCAFYTYLKNFHSNLFPSDVFGLTFVEAMMDDAECWSPDVRKLEVVHVDEGVLGYRTLHLFIFKWIIQHM